MGDGRFGHYWWLLVVCGVLFPVSAILGLLDPTEAITNPYTHLEVYTDVPTPHNLQAAVGVALGLTAVLSVIVLEFAHAKSSVFRAFQGPLHLFFFVLILAGFLLEALSSARGLRLTPDLSYYYFAAGGRSRHAAALATELVVLDPDGWFISGGSALYAGHLSLEGLRRRWLPRPLGVVGVALGVTLILRLVAQVLDRGTYSSIFLAAVMLILAPGFFVGHGLHLRRQEL
jgi:hypothetical protein